MPQEFAEMAKAGIDAAFHEYLDAVEHMQNLMNTDTTDFADMNLASDKPSVLVRRKFLQWTNEEYTYPEKGNLRCGLVRKKQRCENSDAF